MTGYPPVLGDTTLEKRRYIRSNLDHLRVMLMYEPRGHADISTGHYWLRRLGGGRYGSALHAQ